MNNSRVTRRLVIGGSLLLAMALTAGSALAQQIEIHPYAGGFFPGKWADTANFKKEGIYGIRGGVYLIDFVELDANLGYINHFKFRDTPDFGTRAFIWDFNGSYSLNGYKIKKAEPFVTIGLGGLTAGLHGTSGGQNIASTFLSTPLKDNDSFLQFTYGGGIKGVRLWGPLGVRADVRGRTMPNFYGGSLTWLEATGGINVILGAR
jgi:hypothetical protein